jgi:hypothetical protein
MEWENHATIGRSKGDELKALIAGLEKRLRSKALDLTGQNAARRQTSRPEVSLCIQVVRKHGRT